MTQLEEHNKVQFHTRMALSMLEQAVARVGQQRDRLQ